jgi:carbamoyltransferase
MILTFNVSEDIARRIRAVVHVDNTVRPQEVSKDVNPRYHRLIEAFARRTGVPVVLNTSFNVKGEPIVCKPTDALRTFFATGLDALAIGNCLVQK